MWQLRGKEVSGEELDWDVICLPSQSGKAQPLSFIWKTPFLTLCAFVLASGQGGNRLGSWVSLTALENNVRNVWILSKTQQICLVLGQEHYVQIICFKEHHLYLYMGLISCVFSVCVLVPVDVSLFLASCVCLYRFVLIFLILSFEVLTALKVSGSSTLRQVEIHLVYNKMPSKWKQIVKPTMQHLGPPLLGWLAERRRRMRLFIFSAE